MYLRGRGEARSSGRDVGTRTGQRYVGPEEGFYEDLARQNIVARLFQRQLGFRRRHTWVSVWSHMGFSHCRSVLRPLFRTLHGLLRYQHSSVLFQSVYLSVVRGYQESIQLSGQGHTKLRLLLAARFVLVS
jgi:hypothetical protein